MRCSRLPCRGSPPFFAPSKRVGGVVLCRRTDDQIGVLGGNRPFLWPCLHRAQTSFSILMCPSVIFRFFDIVPYAPAQLVGDFPVGRPGPLSPRSCERFLPLSFPARRPRSSTAKIWMESRAALTAPSTANCRTGMPGGHFVRVDQQRVNRRPRSIVDLLMGCRSHRQGCAAAMASGQVGRPFRRAAIMTPKPFLAGRWAAKGPGLGRGTVARNRRTCRDARQASSGLPKQPCGPHAQVVAAATWMTATFFMTRKTPPPSLNTRQISIPAAGKLPGSRRYHIRKYYSRLPFSAGKVPR